MSSAIQIPLVVPLLGEEEIKAVERVMRSGQLAQGAEVASFEEEFAEAVGAKFAVAVNSGTAAIHAALEAIGVSAGDEVLTTPFTFAASATPILMQGARPRFIDIDPRTFNADIAAYNRFLGSARAIVGVDLFGLPFNDEATSVPVVEDACQAIGAARNGMMAGARTQVGAFSFYATKNIMTGEGGMLTTNDPQIAEKARRFRHHGQSSQYEYVSLGFNYRMTNIQAAIGRVQLRGLKDLTNRRVERAMRYNDGLKDLAHVTIPFVPEGVKHCYHQYSILVEATDKFDRDSVRKALADEGIATGIYYPKPLHLHPLFAEYVEDGATFPVAERVSKSILALPMHDRLSVDSQQIVVDAIRRAVS